MKKTILLLVSYLIVGSAFSQQKITWEVLNIGLGFGFSKDSKDRKVEDGTSLSFGTSVWINPLENNKISTGIDFTFTGWNRENSGLNQKSLITLLFAEYNHNISDIRLFGGGGVGYSAVIENDNGGFQRKTKSNIALAPRIGIQYKRMKLTGQYNCQGRNNSFFNIKLGYCIPF